MRPNLISKKIKKGYFLLISALLMLELSGCAGLVVSTVKNKDLNIEGVGIPDFQKEKSVKANEQIRQHLRGYLVKGFHVGEKVSKDSALEHWGKADRIIKNGDIEEWQYLGNGHIWVGIIPMIVIPIPLVVPIGHNQTLLTFRENELIKITTKDSHLKGPACAIYTVHTGPSCGFFSDSD